MYRLASAVLAAAIVLTGLADAAETPAPRLLDVRTSTATFRVSHLYVSAVTGTVPILRGRVDLVGGSAIPARVEATLDPRGVKSGDDDRDADLQGPDWFDVKRFPVWTYVGSRIVASGPDRFTVDGELTIHGVAQRVPLDGTIVRGLPDPRYRAVGHADRHGFGMAVTRSDALVGTQIEISLDVAVAR